jgi:hypothetical protein
MGLVVARLEPLTPAPVAPPMDTTKGDTTDA